MSDTVRVIKGKVPEGYVGLASWSLPMENVCSQYDLCSACRHYEANLRELERRKRGPAFSIYLTKIYREAAEWFTMSPAQREHFMAGLKEGENCPAANVAVAMNYSFLSLAKNSPLEPGILNWSQVARCIYFVPGENAAVEDQR